MNQNLKHHFAALETRIIYYSNISSEFKCLFFRFIRNARVKSFIVPPPTYNNVKFYLNYSIPN